MEFQIYIETSSSVDDRTVHNRRLELQSVDIHAIDGRMLQWLRRLLSIEIEIFLNRIQPMPQRQRHVDA